MARDAQSTPNVAVTSASDCSILLSSLKRAPTLTASLDEQIALG